MTKDALKPEPLTAEAFRPYGDVIEAAEGADPFDYTQGLQTLRPQAKLRLTAVHFPKTAAEGLSLQALERHPFSSQSFFPLSVARYLVAVAPKDEDGGPDVAKLRLFEAKAGQGITYRADVWHHGMCVLDEDADFLILMWQDGSSGDQEIRNLEAAIPVKV